MLCSLAIDERAKEIAVKKSVLPPCLHIPIAAIDENAIKKYIGEVTEVLVPGKPNKALLVHPHVKPVINEKLKIWDLSNSAMLHYPKQVWVHVDFSGYRQAYIRGLPEEDLTGFVLDHVLNRRVSRLKGFRYLRIVPISRAANSSSGGLSEKWAVEYQSSPRMVKWNKENRTFIQYADLADIVKMLDIKTGGSLQDPVNEAQKLVEEV